MISVIIPAYNRAALIGPCIESVLAQTYKDYEIIVVDDGSNDDLEKALKPYKDRIRYFYQDNGGAASARNSGLRKARGDAIAFLDSDDRWFKRKLEWQIKIMDRLPEVAFVHTDFSCDHKQRGWIGSYMREFFHEMPKYGLDHTTLYRNRLPLRDFDVEPGEKDVMVYWGNIADKVIMGPMFLLSSALIRRKCIDEAGEFDEKYRTAEDFDFFSRIALRYPVAYMDTQTLTYLRGHSDQLSSSRHQVETYRAWVDIVNKLWGKEQDCYAKDKKIIDWRLSHYYYSLGVACHDQREYPSALRAFSRSLRLNPLQRRIYLYTAHSMLKAAPGVCSLISRRGSRRNG